MSWIDNLLSSSLIVWLMILFGAVHIYLKKSGKTLLEMFRDIQEFFNGLSEEQPIKK